MNRPAISETLPPPDPPAALTPIDLRKLIIDSYPDPDVASRCNPALSRQPKDVIDGDGLIDFLMSEAVSARLGGGASRQEELDNLISTLERVREDVNTVLHKIWILTYGDESRPVGPVPKT